MSDPISELLAATALECAAEAGRLAGRYIDHPFERRFTEILRARLGPILEAGQACADAVETECGNSGPESCDRRWRAAWEAAQRR